MDNSEKLNILSKTMEEALSDNVMPTPEQWIRVKINIQKALNGSMTNRNLMAVANNGHTAHFIGVYPSDFDDLMESLEFTQNDDCDIV